MPEVGVLNLTIQDNSAKAAGGLSSLSSALIKLQTALGDGLKLSGIAGPLNKFANTVSNSSKTLSNIGAFLNAVSSYQKAFKDAEKVKFNAQPIAQLKEAIGDGIKLGQAGTQIKNIREALEGTWNTDNAYNAGYALTAIGEGAKSVPSNLGTKATQISKLAAALNEYADATNAVKAAVGSGDAAGMTDIVSAPVEQAKQDVVDYEQVVNQMKDLQEETKVAFREPLMPLNLQFFAEGGETDAFEHVASSVHSASEETQNFNVRLEETKDILESIKVNPFEDMYQSFSKLAHEFDWFRKESLRLMSGDSPLLLGDGRTPGQLLLGDGSEPETFLSTWVDKAEQWKPDWSTGSDWKPDWIIGEGTVTEAIDDIKNSYDQASESADKYANSLENIEDLQTKVNETLNEYDPDIEFARQWNQGTNKSSGIADSAKEDIEWINNLVSNASQVDLVRMKIDALTDKLYEGATSGKMTGDQIANLVSQIQNLQMEVDNATGSTLNLGLSFKDLTGGIKRMFPTLTGMIKRLGTIAKYRFIRSVIKHITEGFSEGVQNVYEYNKAIGGSFAPAMDSAATAIAQMKNSLGAALAPAIQAVIPYVNQLVNWFITLVNYVNQFFALLNGQATWTRALPETVNAFDKQKKAAKGAGAAIKDLLADWDELNIIQSESSGGGAGSTKTAEDYLKMFEEVGRFDNKIKDIVGYIQDHIGDVLNIVKDIGLAILGWKFSHAFTGLLGKLGSLISVGLIVKLSADITSFIDQLYIDTGNEMLVIADVILNSALAAVSGKLASAEFGTGAGEIVAGITLSVSAGATFSKAKEAKDIGKDAESDVLSVAGAIKAGIADALVTAGFLAKGVPLPLAATGAIAVVALATVISMSLSYTAKKVQEEKEAAEEAFKNKSKGGLDPAAYLEALQIKFDEATKDASLVLDAHVEYPQLKETLGDAIDNINAMTNIIKGDGSISKADAEAFQEAWTIVFNTLTRMNDTSFNTILSGLNVALSTVVGEAKTQLEELRTAFIEIEHNVSGKTAELYDEMNQTINRLLENNYTNNDEKQKDIERYTQLAESIQIMTDTSIDKLKASIEKGKGIDFSETGFEGLEDWLKEVSQASDDAKKTWDESVSAYEESINFKRKELEGLVHAGTITPEMAEEYNTILDQVVAKYREAVERQKAIIDSDKNSAFADAIASMFSGDISIAEWRHTILPALQKIKEYGGELPEWIYAYLKEGMEGNLLQGRWGLTDTFFDAAFSNAGEYGSQRTAKEFVDDLNLRIKQILNQSGTEEYYREIANLFNIDGVDILSDDWKETIIREAHKAGLDDSFIEDLKKELGFDKEIEFDTEIKPRVKTVIPDKNEAEKYKRPWWDFLGLTYQPPTEEEKKLIENADFERAVKNDNPMSWMDIFGIAYQPPEDVINPGNPVEVQVEIAVDPILDSDELYQQIRDKILNSDMSDTSVPLGQTFDLWQNDDQETLQELRNKIDQVGITQAFDMLTNFLHGDGWTLGKIGTPNIKASIPTSTTTTTGAFLNGKETVKTEPADPSKDAASVEAGVRKGNSDLAGLIRDLIDVTRSSNNRPINVTVSPSSLWGFHTRASNAQAAAVTGNEG